MRLRIRLLYKLLLVTLLFALLIIVAAGIFPLLDLTNSATNARIKRDWLKKQSLRLFSAILNLKIKQEGELPSHHATLVSNHVSWLDIVIIGQYLPGYFVAKSDILSWPVLGFLSKQAGTIFIRRGDKKHILATAEQMVWLLKQNRNIFAFPEGTTTKGDEVLHFHPSLFQPALLTKSAIQPVVIQYQGAAKETAPFIGDDLFLPHLLKMLGMDKIEVTVSFLPVINVAGKNRHSVSHETREAIFARIAGTEQFPVREHNVTATVG